MIRRLLFMLLVAAPLVAQVTVTPNIGLQVPYYNQQNWQVPIQYDLNRLDLLLSGNLPLAGVNTWSPTFTYQQGAVVTYGGGVYVSLAAPNLGYLPNAYSSWWYHIPTTPGGGIPYPSGTGIPQVAGGASWGSTLGTYGSGSVLLGSGAVGSAAYHAATDFQPAGTYVTSLSVATANGFQGSFTSGATPALTMNTDSTHVLPVNTGASTNYLNQAGTYSVPPGTYTLPLDVVKNDQNNSFGAAYTQNVLGTLSAAKNTAGPVFDVTNPTYGAIADGTSHPLSSVYSTLAAAQVKYPNAQSLTDEIDLVASELALENCWNNSQGNNWGGVVLFPVPTGSYVFNRTLNGLDSCLIKGVNRRTKFQWDGPAAGATETVTGIVVANNTAPLYSDSNPAFVGGPYPYAITLNVSGTNTFANNQWIYLDGCTSAQGLGLNRMVAQIAAETNSSVTVTTQSGSSYGNGTYADSCTITAANVMVAFDSNPGEIGFDDIAIQPPLANTYDVGFFFGPEINDYATISKFVIYDATRYGIYASVGGPYMKVSGYNECNDVGETCIYAKAPGGSGNWISVDHLLVTDNIVGGVGITIDEAGCNGYSTSTALSGHILTLLPNASIPLGKGMITMYDCPNNPEQNQAFQLSFDTLDVIPNGANGAGYNFSSIGMIPANDAHLSLSITNGALAPPISPNTTVVFPGLPAVQRQFITQEGLSGTVQNFTYLPAFNSSGLGNNAGSPIDLLGDVFIGQLWHSSGTPESAFLYSNYALTGLPNGTSLYAGQIIAPSAYWRGANGLRYGMEVVYTSGTTGSPNGGSTTCTGTLGANYLTCTSATDLSSNQYITVGSDTCKIIRYIDATNATSVLVNLAGTLGYAHSSATALSFCAPVLGPEMQLPTKSAAIPIALTWAVGDTLQNSSAAANGIAGWVNVAAGTPGTWAGIPLGDSSGNIAPAQINSTTGTGAVARAISPAFTGTPDASGATQFKLPVGASFASAANGESGYDSTNLNWHDWQNGVDNFRALFPVASPPTSGHVAGFLKSTNSWSLQDLGALPTSFPGFGTTSGTAAQGGVITGAGPIGAAATVPVITFNAAGQLTTVTTAAITPSAIGAGTAAQGTKADNAGAVTGAIKSDGSATFGQAACADLSNAGTGCTATIANYAPLATPTFTTNIATPIVYGGSAAGSTLTLKGTSNGSPSNAYVLLNPSGGGGVGIGTASPTALLSEQSTTATQSAPLGSELVASTDTFTGTGTEWTDNRPGTFSFTATGTNTTPLVDTTLAISGSTRYQVTVVISGYSAGSLYISVGGVQDINPISGNGTFYHAPLTTGTGSLTLTPSSSTFVGTVTVSVKQITGNYSPTYNILDSTGASALEIRSSLASLNNTFLGVNSGQYNILGSSVATTAAGSGNTGIGSNALANSTSGYDNTAVGYQSMYKSVISFFGTALGYQTMYNNTTGTANNALGFQALYTNTTGNYNTAEGYTTLYYNNGNSNTGTGYAVLYSNTSGSNNSGYGFGALGNITTGGSNTAIGVNAGAKIANGTTANQTSSNSTYLGYQAYAQTNGDTNETVIGYGSIGLGSNTTVLGNASVTTLGMMRQTTAATGGTALTIQSSGATSGGTDLNGGNLTLSSGISTGAGSSNLYFQTATAGSSGTTDVTPTTKMTILGNGNVGIGTTAGGSKLTVKGGDAFVDGTATGIILRDTVITTNCYRITIASGLVVPTLVTCPTD